jgi:hypothetical protein
MRTIIDTDGRVTHEGTPEELATFTNAVNAARDHAEGEEEEDRYGFRQKFVIGSSQLTGKPVNADDVAVSFSANTYALLGIPLPTDQHAWPKGIKVAREADHYDGTLPYLHVSEDGVTYSWSSRADQPGLSRYPFEHGCFPGTEHMTVLEAW